MFSIGIKPGQPIDFEEYIEEIANREIIIEDASKLIICRKTKAEK